MPPPPAPTVTASAAPAPPRVAPPAVAAPHHPTQVVPVRDAVKALLYPHLRAGALSRERFKAVAQGAYEVAVERFVAHGAAGAAADPAAAMRAVSDGGGALRGDIASWLRARVDASLAREERAPGM